MFLFIFCALPTTAGLPSCGQQLTFEAWPPPRFLCVDSRRCKTSPPNCAETVAGSFEISYLPVTIFPSGCVLGFPCQDPPPPASPSQPGFSQPRSTCAHGHQPRVGRVGITHRMGFLLLALGRCESLKGGHLTSSGPFHVCRQEFLFQEAPWTAPGLVQAAQGGAALQRWSIPQAPFAHPESSLQGPQASRGRKEEFCAAIEWE